jgi:hypothetical protein
VGTIINVRSGHVELTNSYNDTLESLEIWGALTKFKQSAGTKPYGRLLLKELLKCGDFGRASRASDGVATASSHRRRLWGSGRGHYRSGGHSGSATVRGTTWSTGDRCNGSTRFYVRDSDSGIGVIVNDYGKPGKRNAVLYPGEGYVAR